MDNTKLTEDATEDATVELAELTAEYSKHLYSLVPIYPVEFPKEEDAKRLYRSGLNYMTIKELKTTIDTLKKCESSLTYQYNMYTQNKRELYTAMWTEKLLQRTGCLEGQGHWEDSVIKPFVEELADKVVYWPEFFRYTIEGRPGHFITYMLCFFEIGSQKILISKSKVGNEKWTKWTFGDAWSVFHNAYIPSYAIPDKETIPKDNLSDLIFNDFCGYGGVFWEPHVPGKGEFVMDLEKVRNNEPLD